MPARKALSFVAIVFATLLGARASMQTTPVRTVLTIHWGSASFPSNPILDEAIRQALTSRSDRGIDYFAEYLDSERFPDERMASAFASYLREKYRGRKIDLVIAMSDAVRRFALDHRDELFPEAPIVTAGSRPPDDTTRRDGAGLTGMTVVVAYAETLKLALQLHPSTEEVLVVARSSDERTTDAVRTALRSFSTRVKLTFLNEDTVPRLLARIKVARPGSIILYVWQSQDEPGQRLYPDEVARLVAKAAPVPVYGTSDLYLGTGVVGGVVRGTAETGRRVGEIALRILDGTPARDIPFETARLRPVFDSRALQRWGIAERELPPGSIVSFREPSIWRDHRREVLAVLGALALQSLLIIGLLYQRRARRKAEVESRRSLALAADANRRATMSALTGSMAHELSQPLSSILHNAQAGEMLVASDRAATATLREILSDIRKADVRATQIVERHRMMLRNRQLEKKPIDVHAVVRESLAVVAHETGANQIQVDVDLPSNPCMVSGDPVLLQQVLVNLVMNAMEAMAETPGNRRRVTVRSEVRRDSVEVSVKDSGTGLPANADGRLFEPFVTTKTNGIGIGLTIARSIAEAHGGRMDAHNNPEGGATFSLTLPCIDTSHDLEHRSRR